MQVLACFIDAFRPEYLASTPFLRGTADAAHSTRLKTLLGYSAGLVPSLWTGAYPDEHGLWGHYYHNPQRRRLGSRGLLGKARYWGVFALEVANARVGVFPRDNAALGRFRYGSIDYAPARPRTTTFFDACRDAGVGVHRQDGDFERWRAAGDDVGVYETHIIDAAGHRHGTGTPAMQEVLLRLDRALQALVEATRPQEFLFFSDHGMVDVHRQVDLEGLVRRAGLSALPRFMDSTMGRFWDVGPADMERLAALAREAGFTLLDEAALRRHRVWIDGGRFGHVFLVAPPGVEVYPNHFHTMLPSRGRAMHGYLPDRPESDGFLVSSRDPGVARPDLTDVRPLLERIVGIRRKA